MSERIQPGSCASFSHPFTVTSLQRKWAPLDFFVFILLARSGSARTTPVHAATSYTRVVGPPALSSFPAPALGAGWDRACRCASAAPPASWPTIAGWFQAKAFRLKPALESGGGLVQMYIYIYIYIYMYIYIYIYVYIYTCNYL